MSPHGRVNTERYRHRVCEQEGDAAQFDRNRNSLFQFVDHGTAVAYRLSKVESQDSFHPAKILDDQRLIEAVERSRFLDNLCGNRLIAGLLLVAIFQCRRIAWSEVNNKERNNGNAE